MLCRVFLGSSFDKKFSENLKYIRELLESIGFDIYFSKSQILGKNLGDKIKFEIEKSDICVFILFEKPSDFILNEIGISHALGKEIFVLSNEDIQVGGIAESITDIYYFNPLNFCEISITLTGSFVPIYIKYRDRFNFPNPVLRKYIKCIMELETDEILTSSEIKIINLSNKLRSIRHGLQFYNNENVKDINQKSLEVGILDSDRKYKVKNWADDSSMRFEIVFSPPLVRGEECTYYYNQTLYNYFPMHKSQLKKSHKGYASKVFTISTPTEYLELSIRFPERYIPHEAHCDVKYYKGDTTLYDEVDRIKNNKLMTINRYATRYLISLNIENPKLFASYEIKWKPQE